MRDIPGKSPNGGRRGWESQLLRERVQDPTLARIPGGAGRLEDKQKEAHKKKRGEKGEGAGSVIIESVRFFCWGTEAVLQYEDGRTCSLVVTQPPLAPF